jgi:hypothetical protein
MSRFESHHNHSILSPSFGADSFDGQAFQSWAYNRLHSFSLLCGRGLRLLHIRFQATTFSNQSSRCEKTDGVALTLIPLPSRCRQYVTPSPSKKEWHFVKKTKDQLDMDDFVCPMELGALHGGGRGLRPNGSIASGASTMPLNGALGVADVKQEKTAKQIGAFSREISTLTHSLLSSSNGQMHPVSDDQIFNEASPSTVV